MKKIFNVSVFILSILIGALQLGVTSCTKTSTIYYAVTVIKKDTIISYVKDSVPTVDAGKDTTYHILSSSASIILGGSARESKGTIVSYLWSQVSGPNKAIIND